MLLAEFFKMKKIEESESTIAFLGRVETRYAYTTCSIIASHVVKLYIKGILG